MIEGELNEGQPLRSGGSSEESAGGVVCFSAAGAGAEKERGGRLLSIGHNWLVGALEAPRQEITLIFGCVFS